MTEIWKEIEGASGYYVSNKGRIKSTNYRRTGKAHIMKLSQNQGYNKVNIKGVSYFVHTLVARAFVPNPHGYKDVYHKDRNNLKDDANNLVWVYHNFCKKGVRKDGAGGEN